MLGGGALQYHGKRELREVWASNLEREMAIIREMVEAYPFVAMVRNAHSHLLRSLPSL